MWEFQDAWLLTVLLLADDQIGLKDVIAGGDFINHAIFTSPELNTALSRLVWAGYVEIEGGNMMGATEKAKTLCGKALARGSGHTITESVLAKLKKSPPPAQRAAEKYFSESQVRHAEEEYFRGTSAGQV